MEPQSKVEQEAQILSFIQETHRGKREDSPVAPPKAGKVAEAQSDELEDPFEGLIEPEPEDDQESNDDVDTQAPIVDTSKALDLLEFARENPDVKFRFPNKDAPEGYIEMDAKKAAAILSQGGAIHRNAQQLKIKQAAMEEEHGKRKEEQESLLVAMEMTIEPRLHSAGKAIQEAIKHREGWQRWAQENQDPESMAKAEMAIAQNNRVIEEAAGFIQDLKPKAEYFMNQRREQVKTVLDSSRKNFQNTELRNEVIFNDLRDNLKKEWAGASNTILPGIQNLDLVSSDEALLSLLRDGLKYRNGPKLQKSAGRSLSGLTSGTKSARAPGNQNEELQRRANSGDKKAQENVILDFLNQNKRKR